MNSKKAYLRAIATFMCVLVLSMPIYAADALASLSITKNTGTENVPGFIDARDDIWTLDVNAALPQGGSVQPNQVKVNGFRFDTCAASAGGVYSCRYQFDYRNSVIIEESYPINIKLYDSSGVVADTVSSTVVADGTAPVLSDVLARQSSITDATVSFTVDEEPDECVGLQKIQFFDASAGTLLKTINGSAIDNRVADECGENEFTESMTLQGSTTTPRSVKVVAFDKMGHNSSAVSNSFLFDRIAPMINESSFRVGDYVGYVPGGTLSTSLSVQVTEDQDILDVFGTSNTLGMNREQASCEKTDLAKDVFTCVWESRDIDLSQSLSVVVLASDGANNQTRTVGSGLAVDSVAPTVTSFGSKGVFNGINYISSDGNTFVARFAEGQSGMRASSVLADFSELNSVYGTRRAADRCVNAGQGSWECFWDGISALNDGVVFLVGAEDMVGNEVTSLPSAETVRDMVGPVIGEVSVVALAGQEGTARDYFQSRDLLRITFDVNESKGMSAFVNVSDIVSNGGALAASCDADEEGSYSCSVTTDRIISGFDPDARITLVAEDTAGNKAEKVVSIQILATDEDTNPDFWSKGVVECSPNGLDLSTVKLAPQRVFCSVPLSTGAEDVSLLYADLVGCDGEGDADLYLANSFMINNFAGSTAPIMVLEFAPFEDEVNEAKYECVLRLTSKRGNTVVQQTEEETVNVTVPFYLSKFDKEISSIEDEIDAAKAEASGGFNGIIGTLSSILKWILILCKILLFIKSFQIIMSIINGNFEALRATVFGIPAAIAGCEITSAAKVATGGIAETLQTFCMIASCTPSPSPTSWYGRWQKAVLDFYNKWTFRSALGQAAKATSLTDNLPLSVAGLCLPGVILNMEKLRQVQCRYVSCLENEVKAGVTTIEGCRELKDYQECKYVWGEVFQVVPFVGGLNQLLGILKSILADPVGIARTAAVIICARTLCAGSNSAKEVCDYVGSFIFFLDTINDIISGFEQISTTTKGDYCSQVGL